MVHDTPEHNGVAERGNCTNLEIICAMLHDNGLPKFLWAEAVSHAIYLCNHTWTRAIGNATPYELLNGQKPNMAGLHPWGCKVQAHNTEGSKLDGRSKIGWWVGFDPDTKDGHIERSVKFNFDNEIVVHVSPLEGEIGSGKLDTELDTPKILPEAPDTESAEDMDVIKPIEPVPSEGRGK